jgi:hypothetical protein
MKPRYLLCVIVFLFNLSTVQSQKENTSPSYIKDITIYEIAPKAFSSPNGPETGTFKSMMEKLPYLKELGINSIWLTGHNWADNAHFYGIWTQYATIRPDSIEPTLGTPADFKLLVQTAHKNGIKIILDVITHGVMTGSPLIKQHPDWFKGGSWGMTDYDWKGGHKDLDNWWIKTWTDYALKYGVDGFRLDVSVSRPDLWKQIKLICAQAGSPIFVMNETNETFYEGAFEFYQHHSWFMDVMKPDIDSTCLFTSNVAQYFITDTSKQNYFYSNQLSCHDNGWNTFPAGINPYVAEGSRYLFGYSFLLTPTIPVFMAGEEFNADYTPLPRLAPDLFGKIPPSAKSRWLYGSWIQWDQLKQPDKKAMWNDVQHMLAIRKSERDIIHAIKLSDKNKKILSVEIIHPDSKLPVPYLMWNNNTAILVAANPLTDRDIDITVKIPLEQAGLRQDKFKVTNLWIGGKSVVLTKDELQLFRIKIKRDKQPRGGVVIYKIEGI